MDNFKKLSFILLVLSCTGIFCQVYGQDSLKRYSLEEIIELAKERSSKVLEARAAYLSSYWEHRTFVVSNLPHVNISPLTYSYNHSLMPTYNKDSFLVTNTLNYGVGLNFSQNVPLTGGQVSVSSNLMTARDVKSLTTNYSSNLYLIQYSQPITFFNNFKWEHKTERLRIEQAKRIYIQAIEQISLDAVDLFFGVASAQISYEIAELNYHNSDTLYKLSKARYQIGKIVESELLQMQLSHLQARSALTTSKSNLETQQSNLSSYLNLSTDDKFELIIPDDYPKLSIDPKKAWQLTKGNNPDMLTLDMKLIDAEKNVKQMFWDSWFSGANLTASYGISSYGPSFSRLPDNSSTASGLVIGMSIPITNYGIKEGKYRMAKLNKRIVAEQTSQQFKSIERTILNIVTQFNQQNDLLKIEALSDTIAQKRYFITKQRFMNGKIDVLDLNKATTDKDNSRNQYINALRNYWGIFYTIRKLTLFDFYNNKPIQTDFDDLLKK
jgi:outer membrane protein TolC